MSSSTDAAQAAENAPDASKRPERKSLGKYEIQKKIGAGGMGTVFLALDTELRRTVALKVLPKERAQNPMLVRRFKSEGQKAAHLRHANLVTVFEAGEIDGYLYIALEYVEGTDVHHLVEKRGPVPVKRSIAIIRQVTKALDHAYEQNIVHRDIKPSNLLIQRDGSVKLTDFGLARSVDEETETAITRAGTTVGTVDFMSPEQARDSKAADIRSDLYSLGCTWYHMLTGEPPYPEGAVTNKLQAHASEPPPDPRTKNPSVPEGVVAAIHRLMAKDPSDRYQTPAELLADLDRPALERQTLSNNVLAGLMDGDAELPVSAARRPVPVMDGGPPSVRKPVGVSPVAKSEGWDPELVRYAIIGAIVVAILALVWWVISQFASTVDPPSNTPNPFASVGNVTRTGDVDPAAPQQRTVPAGSAPSAETPPDGTPRAQSAQDEAMAAEPGAETAVDPAAESVAGIQVGDASPADRSARTAIHVRRGEDLPDWIAELTTPADELRGSDRQPLPVLTVGRADGKPGDFADLETALARVPRTGAVVRLVGPGPFELTPTRIAVQGPLVIEAADGERPAVMLRPDRDGAAARIVQVETDSLAITDLDLIVVARQFTGSDPLALIEVIGGDAAVRRTSVTLVGERSGPTLAFRTIGRTGAKGAAARADPGRLLLDRVLVRGADLSALGVSRATSDAVVSQSLFISDAAPVFILSSPPPVSAAEDPSNVPSRLLRLFSTTAVSSRSGFLLEHSEGEPPPTRVDVVNSLVSAPAGSSSTMLLEFGAWPGVDSAPSSWAPQGLLVETEASAFPGWKLLVRASSQAQGIASSTDWGRLWDRPVPLNAFSQEPWPQHNPEPSTAAPQQFDRTTFGRTVVGKDGEPPGCRSDLVPQPAPEYVRRAVAAAERPVEPADFDTGPLGARIVRIDASRDDPGEVISRGDWDNGTRFVVSGSGVCRTTPIEVRGKSLSIEFDTKDAGFCLEPQAAAFTGGQAMLTIEDGDLRLLNARVRVPGESGDVRWFLHMTDGNFSLMDCAIEGPSTSGGNWDGFLRWDRRETSDPSSSRPGEYERFARVSTSYLCGTGTLLRADMSDRAFVARGSVLAAAESVLSPNIQGNGDPLRAAVELSNCTLATGGTFIDIQGRRGSGTPAALRLYVERSIFTPFSADPSDPRPGPVLLRDATSSRAQRPIEWWGRANGYADGIGQFLAAPSGGAPADDFDGWSAAWGSAGELRPLHAPDAVRIGASQSQRLEELTPARFALEESSPARTWSADGGPIGADAARLPALSR